MWGGYGCCTHYYCVIKLWTGFQNDGNSHVYIYHKSGETNDLGNVWQCDSPPFEDAYSWEAGFCDPIHTNGIYRVLLVLRIHDTSPTVRAYTIVRYIINE
jgi:hypothetical protein